jgi:hypothetical protein
MTEKKNNFRIATKGWEWVKEAALTTVHKEAVGGSRITSEWKKKILLSEHSPIRELSIRWKMPTIKRWVADQLVRSRDQSYMGTMRTDRGNVPRSEQTMETETELLKSSNAQHIIDTARKRLCIGCVSKETRELFEEFVEHLSTLEPELASMCVPNCVYRGGCPEFKPCGHYEKFIEQMTEDDKIDSLLCIENRYEEYRRFRNE